MKERALLLIYLRLKIKVVCSKSYVIRRRINLIAIRVVGEKNE